jgi:hypothetical protein
MQEILGNQQQGEVVEPNMSGKAIELVQNKLDMQTFIYMSNFAKAVKRCGEVWLSMAREIYVEPSRKMKAIQTTGEPRTVVLAKPMVNKDTGAIETENDIADAKFDVAVDVGPSTASRRASVVRAITGMMQLNQDPETGQILTSMAMMNMEGEGLSEMQQFFRKKLLKAGVIEPNEDEAAAMQEELAQLQGQPDPQAELAAALTDEAKAKASLAMANTEKSLAQAEESRANTIVKLTDAGMSQEAAANPQPAPRDEKAELELEALRLENRMRKNKADATDTQVEQLKAERMTNDSMMQASVAMQQAVTGLSESVAVIGDAVGQMSQAVGQFAAVSSENTDKAIAALSKPKRFVREKGRITKIETET